MPQAQRQPLNLAADDLRAALELQPLPLRVLIDRYRSRVLAQKKRAEDAAWLESKGQRSHRPVNATAEYDELHRLKSLLHYLLVLHRDQPPVQEETEPS